MRSLVTLIGCFVTLLAFGCAEGPALEREVAALRDLTVPPEGRAVAYKPPEKVDSVLRATWTVETPTTWEAYAPWLRERLHGFRETNAGSNRMAFARALDGDQILLQLETKDSPSKTLVVEVSFVATPY